MTFSSVMKGVGLATLVIIIPLLIGLWVAKVYVPKPAVGVIRLNMEIWAGSDFLLAKQIEQIRKDTRIKAVVVQIDSPGGEVVAGQNMFMGLRNLRRDMPVVGSIDNVCASGGFYIAMALDPVFAKPSSEVGNVGVWSFAPMTLGVNDTVLASGPFKLTATNQDEFVRNIETIKQEFMETVYSQRGDRIKISQTELSQGLLYNAREGVKLGLIDRIGTQTDAIEFAAEQAGIKDYDVVDLLDKVFMDLFGEPAPLLKPIQDIVNPKTGKPHIEPWVGAADPLTHQRNLPPGIYMLYDPWSGDTSHE